MTLLLKTAFKEKIKNGGVPKNSGKKKEHKPKLFGPDIFRWGGGLPREGVGAEKFGSNFFLRDVPGFCRDIPGVPEKFEKKKVCVQVVFPIYAHIQELSGTPNPWHFLKKYWRRTAVQIGGVLQKLRTQRGHSVTNGVVLRYKLEVYRQYFSDKLYGLGVPKQSPHRGTKWVHNGYNMCTQSGYMYGQQSGHKSGCRLALNMQKTICLHVLACFVESGVFDMDYPHCTQFMPTSCPFSTKTELPQPTIPTTPSKSLPRRSPGPVSRWGTSGGTFFGSIHFLTRACFCLVGWPGCFF